MAEKVEIWKGPQGHRPASDGNPLGERLQGHDRFLVHTVPPTVVSFLPDIPGSGHWQRVRIDILKTPIDPSSEAVTTPATHILDQEIMMRAEHHVGHPPTIEMAPYYAARAILNNRKGEAVIDLSGNGGNLPPLTLAKAMVTAEVIGTPALGEE